MRARLVDSWFEFAESSEIAANAQVLAERERCVKVALDANASERAPGPASGMALHIANAIGAGR